MTFSFSHDVSFSRGGSFPLSLLFTSLSSLHLSLFSPHNHPLLSLYHCQRRIKNTADEMEALADTFLEQPPLDYDSDAAADEIGAVTEPAHSSKIGMRTCTEIFKNALENRTGSKAALKNHVPQARAPSTQQSKRRVLVIFQAFMKSLQVP